MTFYSGQWELLKVISANGEGGSRNALGKASGSTRSGGGGETEIHFLKLEEALSKQEMSRKGETDTAR